MVCCKLALSWLGVTYVKISGIVEDSAQNVFAYIGFEKNCENK